MIKASEFFSPNFKAQQKTKNPCAMTSRSVKEIIEKIEKVLAQGEVAFYTYLSLTDQLENREKLNQTAYTQLINKLVNEQLKEFGWIAYISQSDTNEHTFIVKLALTNSELEQIKLKPTTN